MNPLFQKQAQQEPIDENPTPDQDMIIDRVGQIYVLLNHHVWGRGKTRLGWQWAVRLGPKAQEYLNSIDFNAGDFKLVTTNDPVFTEGRAQIQEYRGWNLPRSPEQTQKLQELWDSAPVPKTSAADPEADREARKLRFHKFIELADTQRGTPESAMLKIQHDPLGPGVYSFAVEHTGDLTHRMNQETSILYGTFGYDNVKDKVEKVLRYMESGYGFEREMQGNLRNNYEAHVDDTFKGVPFGKAEANFKAKCVMYASAHKVLKVYNRPQMLARDAAVALGDWDFDGCRDRLRALKEMLDKGLESWVAACSIGATKTAKKGPHKNANTQFNLPPDAAKKMMEAGRNIPDSELGVDGREDEPHITIKYGVTEDIGSLSRALQVQDPFTATLGKTHVFEVSESSTGQAPVVVEVNAPELKILHDKVDIAIGSRPDDFPYKPHVTLAYVKPEFAKKYDGMDWCEGISFRVDNVLLSQRNGEQVPVPLGKPMDKAIQSSHKTPPFSDTRYKEPDGLKGEGSNAYSMIPEYNEDNMDLPSIGQLTAAEKIAANRWYHLSPHNITSFRPFTHFGTLKAAQDRNKEGFSLGESYTSSPTMIYEVELNVKNPLDVPDLEAGKGTAQHSWLKLADQLHYDTKTISAAERDQVIKAGQTKGDTAGYTELAKVLKSHGYDGLRYINEFEDPGSTSYVIFEPSQAKIVRKFGKTAYADESQNLPATGMEGVGGQSFPKLHRMPLFGDEEQGEEKTAGKGLPKFYHGTARKRLDNILQNGLQPGHDESSIEWGKAIYLACDAYTAANYEGHKGEGRGDWVILEIDGKKLHEDLLRPDDYDFRDIFSDMSEEDKAQCEDNWAWCDWRISLQHSCQVAYLGNIPPDAIKVIDNPQPRYATGGLKAWFDGSKVVDKNGKPRIVYHGSRSSWIDTFDMNMEGQGVHGHTKWGAIWFTSSEENAQEFADPKEEKPEASTDEVSVYGQDPYYAAVSDINGEDILFTVGPHRTPEEAQADGLEQAAMYNKTLEDKSNVHAVYLKIVNPLVIDKVPRDAEFKAAKDGGHDGIIAYDVVDGYTRSDVFVVFSPNQVKSATHNRGTYDPKSESIIAAAKRAPLKPQPKYVYHVAEATANESIQQHGLDSTLSKTRWNPQDGKGFYAFTDYMDAVKYIDDIPSDEGTNYQIWRVKPAKAVVSDDSFFVDDIPSEQWMDDEGQAAHSAVFHPGPVPSSNIELVAEFNPDEHEFVFEDRSKTAKDEIIGQVYLLHFDIEPNTVIPSSRDDAKQPFHARHYLGWAENAQERIEQHYKGQAARITQALKEKGITFTVAKIWDDVDRHFERRLKNQGGLSRQCPICKELGIDRDTLRKKKIEVQEKEQQAAPATPEAGPDYVEAESTTKFAYLPQEMQWLKSYLTMSDREKGVDLVYKNPRDFVSWMRQNGYDEYLPQQADPRQMNLLEPQQEVDEEENEEDLVDEVLEGSVLDKIPDDIMASWAEHESNNMLQYDTAEAPSYLTMSYDGLVKNQWLIHFTDDPWGIANGGFKYGVDDMDRIALTTWFSDAAKKGGGYNFAYLLSDFMRYSGARGGKTKYGSEAVIFRASGIKVWHSGDDEPQIIFRGSEARDIVPITKNYDEWVLPENSKGRPIYQNEDLSKITDWVTNNWAQYQQALRGEFDKGVSKQRMPKEPQQDANKKTEMPWDENGVIKPQPAMASKSAAEPFEQTQNEYAPYPKINEQGLFEETDEENRSRYKKKQDWEQSALAAISEGRLDPAVAKQRGLYLPGQFKSLPSPLYHVTTAMSSVQSGGLKTRWQLQMSEGAGLGGGTNMAISFTEDVETAKGIYLAIVEGKKVASGQLTIPQMVEMAKNGTGAPRPWLYEAVTWGGAYLPSESKWKLGDPYPEHLQALLEGKKIESLGALSGKTQEEMPNAEPIGQGWNTGDGRHLWSYWKVPMSEQETRDRAFDFYKTWCATREHVGGPLNPLFFSSDTQALAKVPDDQIGILQFTPRAGALGTQESALGEWRTYSGLAVEMVGTVDPYSKTAAKKEEPVVDHTFYIEVPSAARGHFWDEPPAHNLEFWAFKGRPNVLPNETVYFTFDKVPVAETIVMKVEKPGMSKCELTGDYENHYKVYWEPAKFKRYASEEHAAPKIAKHMTEFYHGTSWENADKIKAEGLKAQPWELGEGSWVWATIIQGQAQSYGISKTEDTTSQYAVVGFMWDYDATEPDPEHLDEGDAFRRIPENVPASAITKIWYYDEPYGSVVKTAAARSIYYHGTSINNLRSILSEGLVPEGKQKVWEDDPDASKNQPSRQAYGGIYVTRNLLTATGAPKDTQQNGSMLLVMMELQPNTMYLDEDSVTHFLSQPLGHMGENNYHIICYYLTATQDGVRDDWRQDAEAMRDRYIERCIEQWKNKFKERDMEMHSDLEARLRQLLPECWKAAVVRLAGYAADDNYDFIRAWGQVFYDMPKVDQRPDKNTIMPSTADGEAKFRTAAEQITRTMRLLARPTKEGELYYHGMDNARITEPIGYSGANHIICVLEIRDTRKYRGEDFKQPAQMILYYGEVPDDFKKQWDTRHGSKYTVIDQRGGKARAQHASLHKEAAKTNFPVLTWEQWLEKNPMYQPDDPQADEWRYDENVAHFSTIKFPLTVFRALEIETGSGINFDHLGESWTWVENSADAYFGSTSMWGPEDAPELKKPQLVIIKAQVQKAEDVNWPQTMYANMLNEEENEVTIWPGRNLKIVAVDWGKGYQKPPRQNATASLEQDDNIKITRVGDILKAKHVDGQASGTLDDRSQLADWFDINSLPKGDTGRYDKTFVLSNVSVKATSRRGGIGRALVGAILDAARQEGAEVCFLLAQSLTGTTREELNSFYTSIGFVPFYENVYMKKLASVSKFAAMNRISQQDAVDRKMFGPVYHGTTEERQEQIGNDGFKVFIGDSGSGDVAHGYEGNQPYHDGIPAPVHHLGYGIYFTTAKSIAKTFAGGTTRGMKTYYLDVPNLETINFGAPKTMMKWWISQGYDPQLAKKNRVDATKAMTDNLKSKFDAVWYKGKGMYKLLDGDQICVFDPSKVYEVDPKMSKPGDIGSKVTRKADGMKGVIKNIRPIPADIGKQYHGGADRFYEVKWNKGGTDHNVYARDIDFVGAEKAQGATAAAKPKGMPIPSELQGDCWITPNGKWIDCEYIDHATMAAQLGFKGKDPTLSAVAAGYVRVVVNAEAFGVPKPSAFMIFQDSNNAARRAGAIIRRLPVTIEVVGIEEGRGNYTEYSLAEAEEKFPDITFKQASFHCVACESGECLEHESKTAEGFNEEGFWAGEGNGASGVLPICTTTGRICLAWRSPDVHIGDCWGTIGGAIKKGMNPAESAKAELKEETGFGGGINMKPAFVFQSGDFKYHNFIGTVGTEFRFAPQSEHHWETTGLEWFTLEQVKEMLNSDSGSFHPGVIALFKHSGKEIEKMIGGKAQSKEAGTRANYIWVWHEKYGVRSMRGKSEAMHWKFFADSGYDSYVKNKLPKNLYDECIRGYATVESTSFAKFVVLTNSTVASPEMRFIPKAVAEYYKAKYPDYEVVGDHNQKLASSNKTVLQYRSDPPEAFVAFRHMRPFERDRMIQEAEMEFVSPYGLYTSQETVDAEHVQYYVEHSDEINKPRTDIDPSKADTEQPYPLVIRTNDGDWLFDGNHRANAAMKTDQMLEVKIVDMRELEEHVGHVTAARGEWQDAGLLTLKDALKWRRYWEGRGHSTLLDKVKGGLYRCSLKLNKTAAPAHDAVKGRPYFHGTDQEALARKIMTEGIQPRTITMPDKAKSKAKQAPVPDRVYMTDDFSYAAIYALGGQMFGTKSLKFIEGKDPFGYIFQINGADLKGDVVPDEDSIGEALHWRQEFITDSKRLKELETQPERWKGEKEGLLGGFEIVNQQPINKEDVPDEIKWELDALFHRLTPGQQKGLQEAATQSQVGKKLQKYLSQNLSQWLLDHGAHLAHQGAVHPVKAWKVDKKKAIELGGPVENWATEVPMAQAQTASITAATTFMYHGTSSRDAEEVLKSGQIDAGYWGTEAIAEHYGDGGVIFRIPISRFNQANLSPDENMIQDPLTYTLGREEEDEDAIYEKWKRSKKTWKDSLKLYGAVYYDAPMQVTQADVLAAKTAVYGDEETSGTYEGDELEDQYSEKFPPAGERVDGRLVRDNVPNLSSINATFRNYITLDGIREVPLSVFEVQKPVVDQRTKALAEEIKHSGELNPLIVGIDAQGAYIVEGGHRFDALLILGAKSFPAVVALDLDDLNETKKSALEPDEITNPDKEFDQQFEFAKSLGWSGMNPWYPERWPWFGLRLFSDGWRITNDLAKETIADGSTLAELKQALSKYDLKKLRSEKVGPTINAQPVQKKLVSA